MVCGVKLSRVLSDLLGVTGRGIIEALIAGETSPDKLSWKVRGSLRKKEKQVKESLKGCFDEFHREVLKRFYRQYTFLSSEIEQFEKLIEERMAPYVEKVERLDGIPGIDRLVAWHSKGTGAVADGCFGCWAAKKATGKDDNGKRRT